MVNTLFPCASRPSNASSGSYEPLAGPTVQLTWGCLDLTTLLLVLAAAVYIGYFVLEQLQLSEFAFLFPGVQPDQTSLGFGLIDLCLCLCLILLLGAARPLKGGKGYDYEEHESQDLAEAFCSSKDKVVNLAFPVGGACSACFQLLADVWTLVDLYEDPDWLAFSVKLSMLLLAAFWAALWAYSETPSALTYMPPLGLRSRSTSWLPWCVAFLALVQLLPACLLLVCLLIFICSDSASEVERALRKVHLRRILTALGRASLLTERVPGFLLNIILLNSADLSPTSWRLLAISTLITGCFLTHTFAEIDGHGHVSHWVKGLPTVVGAAPHKSGLFAFIVSYRAVTLFANSFLLLVLQRIFGSAWNGMALVGLDLTLQVLQVWIATENWRKVPFAVWALLSPPEPMLHTGRPLFTCKLQVWAAVKAALFMLVVLVLFVLTQLDSLEIDYSDPVLRVLLVAVFIQWPLFFAIRQAAYPESEVSDDYFNLEEDRTAEEVPLHLLRLWWESSPQKDISSSAAGDHEADLVGCLLELDQTVKELTLTDNEIGPEGCAYLCSGLSQNRTLEKLFLDGNPLGPESVRHLPNLATSSLQLLSLSRTKLGSKLEPLVELLAKTRTLERLYLNSNDIGPRGARHLAEGIERNDSLKVLTLNKNQLQEGASALFRACAGQNGQLETLYVQQTGIKDAEVGELLRIPKLKKVNLAKNHFSLHLLADKVDRGFAPTELKVTASTPADRKLVQRMETAGVQVTLVD